MDIKEQLKDIKTQLRLSMNGAVSQSMREKGLLYKLNFGVELPRIKMIAEGYEKNHDLAQSSEEIWQGHTANAEKDSCKSTRLFRYFEYPLPRCPQSPDKRYQSVEAWQP